MRKLIPALYQRFADGQFDGGSRILACPSTALSRGDYLQRAQGQCGEHLTGTEFSEARWTQFAACLDYQQVDATRVEDFRTLKRRIADRDEQTRVWFLSTSPSLYVATAGNMAAAGVATPAARVVLGKQLGTDR